VSCSGVQPPSCRSDLTERSLVLRFIQGLKDKELADERQQGLQNTTNTISMAEVLKRVEQHGPSQRRCLGVRVEYEAAQSLMHQNCGYDRSALFKKPARSHIGCKSAAAPKELMWLAAKACFQAGQYPVDHDLAPCMLKGTVAASTSSPGVLSTRASSMLAAVRNKQLYL
jgi:hypothetical protein